MRRGHPGQTRRSIDERPVRHARDGDPPLAVAPMTAELLSDEERQVLRCLTTAMSVDAIAAELQLPSDTVLARVKVIYGKLHVNTRCAAVQAAADSGLLEG